MQYTLITDGPSDSYTLRPIIDWLLADLNITETISGRWVDFRWRPNPPKDLKTRIQDALNFYPCDLLFVHRDAEKCDIKKREREIKSAMPPGNTPYVCVVPVHMQEAWLLFNEEAIRIAAGNPNGKVKLDLPNLSAMEQLPNPKEILHQALRTACGLSGRRLTKFSVGTSASQVANQILDFRPLRQLSAFSHFETNLRALLEEMHLLP